MFLAAPNNNPSSLRHFADEELLRHLRFSDNYEVAELVRRFELLIDNTDEERIHELKRRREWAISCVSEYAGEDYHADVVKTLRSALTMNKPEMKQAIKTVIDQLNEMDTGAGHLIEAMRDGSAE